MVCYAYHIDSTVRRNIASIALTAQNTLEKSCEIQVWRGMSYELRHGRFVALRMTFCVLEGNKERPLGVNLRSGTLLYSAKV